MYTFSLASNRKSAAEAAAAAQRSDDPTLPSAPHTIRAPRELHPATAHAAHAPHLQHPQPPQQPGAADAHLHGGIRDDAVGQPSTAPVSNARFGWHPGHAHVPTASLYATAPHVEPPVRVHHITGYTDLREAADWSVEVQRERAEKKRRALAQHEAVKLAEQRRRDAQEAQAKTEMHQRRLERQQERADQREAASMADFQDRNTRFLQNQQRLMEVGAYVTQAESQHRTHAREDLYKSWTSRHHMSTASPNMNSWKGSNVAGLASLVSGSLGVSGASGTGVPAAVTATAPATEEELRLAAQATEAAYVQLSLAYHSEAQRSLAAAGILMGGATAAQHRPGRAPAPPPPPPPSGPLGHSASQLLPAPSTTAGPPLPSTAAATSTATLPSTSAPVAAQVGAGSAAPPPPPQSPAHPPAGQGTPTPPPPTAAPFRTAPPMFTHASAAHMGDYANAIPYTYIPAYFDAPSEGATAVQAAAAAAAALASERERLPRRRGPGADGVMPLTLRPVPVSAAVTAALQNTFYPWALHTGAAGTLAKAAASLSAATAAAPLPAPLSLQAAPARGSELPVPQWGVGELRDTRFGHGVAPDGTFTEPCERKKVCAAARGYSTFPRDNATATTNPVEPQLPVHFGKRVDMWL